jgi:CxxC motif-containing protein (DUF1111 family)
MRPGAAAVLGLAAVLAAAAQAADAPPELHRPAPPRADAAYALRQPGQTGLAGLDAEMGLALFERPWVAAPSSTRASDGLGPLYNARSCAACHAGHGRAHPPAAGAALPPGLVVRLAGAGGAPDPVLGAQVQPLATGGLPGEARVTLAWDHHDQTLPDGTVVDMRRPRVVLADQGWGLPRADSRASLRAAPPLIAPGLIAAIPDAAILAGADPQDRNRDGIRGRARLVVPLSGAPPVPGRFGRRAGQAGLTDATAQALSADIGLSSPLLPDPWGDCTPVQAACRAAPHGNGDVRRHEVTGATVALIAAHLATLAVPAAARPADPEGAALFLAAGCAACHRPDWTIPTAQGLRRIRPHSDFLLHDLGPGLADPAPEAGVAPGEWRTAPLWGLGHARAVAGGAESWLHDGRARSLTEAILWHGGTAQAARDAFAAMPAPDRAALIRYLESL